MTEQVIAITKMSGSYPSYFNMTTNADGSVTVSVRADPVAGGPGPYARTTFTKEEWAQAFPDHLDGISPDPKELNGT